MFGYFPLQQEEKTASADINKENKSFTELLMLALTTSQGSTCTILTLGWGLGDTFHPVRPDTLN